MSALLIEPRVGAGDFKFGMTREEAWACTRSPVRSFYPQQFSTERTDAFQNLAIHADYREGRLQRLVAFTSNPPAAARCPLMVLEQELGPECDVEDVVALLELQEVEYQQDDEKITVPSLGLVFGFMEKGDDDELKLEWVAIEA